MIRSLAPRRRLLLELPSRMALTLLLVALAVALQLSGGLGETPRLLAVAHLVLFTAGVGLFRLHRRRSRNRGYADLADVVRSWLPLDRPPIHGRRTPSGEGTVADPHFRLEVITRQWIDEAPQVRGQITRLQRDWLRFLDEYHDDLARLHAQDPKDHFLCVFDATPPAGAFLKRSSKISGCRFAASPRHRRSRNACVYRGGRSSSSSMPVATTAWSPW